MLFHEGLALPGYNADEPNAKDGIQIVLHLLQRMRRLSCHDLGSTRLSDSSSKLGRPHHEERWGGWRQRWLACDQAGEGWPDACAGPTTQSELQSAGTCALGAIRKNVISVVDQRCKAMDSLWSFGCAGLSRIGRKLVAGDENSVYKQCSRHILASLAGGMAWNVSYGYVDRHKHCRTFPG